MASRRAQLTRRREFHGLLCVFMRLKAAVVVLGLLLLARPLQALLLDPLSLETLTRQADVVLQGKVLSKTCLRDAAGRIYTRVELEVLDVWKGAISGTPLVLVHGGGILGDKQSSVAGQAHYAVGEEVVAFLVRNERGEAVTLGLMQGKFQVWKDRVTGIKYAHNPFHGAPPLPGGKLGVTRTGGGEKPGQPLGLAELKRRVQGEGRQ